MPRDFRSFKNTSNKKVSPDEQAKVNEYKNIYDKYKDMNSNELMSSLFSEANKLKQEGKLDNETLNTLSQSLSPFLNNEQKQILSQLLNSIKD